MKLQLNKEIYVPVIVESELYAQPTHWLKKVKEVYVLTPDELKVILMNFAKILDRPAPLSDVFYNHNANVFIKNETQ